MNTQIPTTEPVFAASGWHAELDIVIDSVADRSILRRVRHVGPLRVQRAFYPETDGTCHIYLLHPPGGVVQGDEMHVSLAVGAHSRCLVTTPGATKLYSGERQRSRLETNITVGPGARCEWLPQECIAFSGARGIVQTFVVLDRQASFIGWEITCLGRPASAERFIRGEFVSHLAISRDGTPLLNESLRVAGDDALLSQAWGLRENAAFGSLVVAVPNAQWVDLVRSQLTHEPAPGVVWAGTELDGISIFRAMGRSAATVKQTLAEIWHCCRTAIGTDGNHWPRIWTV